MKLWLALPALRPGQDYRDYAAAAKAAGAEGVTIAEHLIVPETVGEYPYSGKQAVIPLGTQFPDPLTVIADMAAHVDDIRFMTNMLIAPLYHPLVLARQAATVDAMSGGRLDLGVGAGWMREEFDAIDVPFEARGARMNETIELLPQVWSGKPIKHEGKCFSFAASQTPTPPCAIPIFVGGNADVAIRRAAGMADGWSGVGLTEEELAQMLEKIAEISAEVRDPARKPLQIRTLLKGRPDAERLASHAALGIEALVLQSWQVTGKKPGEPETAEEVGEKLAELTAICSGI